MQTTTRIGVRVGFLGVLLAAGPAEAAPKFYFEVRDVKSGVPVDDDLKEHVRQALTDEFKSRPEFTSDLGGATGDAIAVEAKKRKLSAYQISLKIDKFKKETLDPKPGGRMKRVQVGMKVTVFGTTLPGDKISFSGEGETAMESEVTERTLEKEATTLAKDAAKDAIKQAVDQAVLKVGAPQSAPQNEKKRRKKK